MRFPFTFRKKDLRLYFMQILNSCTRYLKYITSQSPWIINPKKAVPFFVQALTIKNSDHQQYLSIHGFKGRPYARFIHYDY